MGLSQGRTNVVHIDLTPGQYAFFCHLPDAGDGKPHVAHGMMKESTIE